MATSLVDAQSLLAIDIGSVNTRALFFDVVEGQYHFIAASSAPSTAVAPYRDVGEGVHQALKNLEKVAGRSLLDDQSHIILPSGSAGTGADCMVLTYSAGPELRVVVAGLLADVSLESASHLISTINARVVQTVGVSDRRRPENLVDAILNSRAELVLLAGGTQNGASRSVLRQVELILLACRILPKERRPRVIYAGNRALAKRIAEVLGKYTEVIIAPNLRPSIDLEDLSPGQEVLAEVVTRQRAEQIGGLRDLSTQCCAPLLPASHAFGRMIQFLSQIYDPQKDVLGVDLGASSTTIASARGGRLALNVHPYGMGRGASNVIEQVSPETLVQWIPFDIQPDLVRDYLWQKSIFPAGLPYSPEGMAIEQALARQVLQLCMQRTATLYPDFIHSFEPLIATGSVVCKAPGPAESLLMLLDGLQPVGITTVVLDQNGVLGALGAIAKNNPILPVQVLESGAFLNLGTVISPVSRAKWGAPILRVRLEYEDGNEASFEIKQGALVNLPLQAGQSARVHLTPLRSTVVDPYSKGRVEHFKVVGGICGAVVDARGRPLMLPGDPTRRHEALKKWASALGIS